MLITHESEKIKIFTGFDMGQEFDIAKEHGARDLSNSIKICVNSSNVHFIQFVTRLTPDKFAFKKLEGAPQRWISELSTISGSYHYMTDANNPRWKVDVTSDSESCYYDEKGAYKVDGNLSAMYDCPGGLYEPIEERAIFCTFIVIDNQVTHKVKWSKQYNMSNESFYSVDVQSCQRLPDWAIKTILEDYNKINKKTFKMSEELSRLQNPNLTLEDLNTEAAEDFLPPPAEWITIRDFPLLFQAQTTQQYQAYSYQ